MRIAFQAFGDTTWIGGINYLTNLLSAISELPGKPITPVLFAGPEIDPAVLARLSPHFPEPPIWSATGNRKKMPAWARTLLTIIHKRDKAAEEVFRASNIDLVFVHATWYGSNFPFPTLVWISDFQHRLFPQMFPPAKYWKRELGFRALMRYGTTIMTSSLTGCRECESLYPMSRAKLTALPFVVGAPSQALLVEPDDIREKYNLPLKFFFLPNQFWRHKNHLGVIEALHFLRQNGFNIVIAASGNTFDPRNPGHAPALIERIKSYGLEANFRILGLVPYADICSLMRASIAIINPSFYEGWSTTVEEAKSIGVPLLLSDIPVHREQMGDAGIYFDPADRQSIANSLTAAWSRGVPGPHVDLEASAAAMLKERRMRFANDFFVIANRTIQSFAKESLINHRGGT